METSYTAFDPDGPGPDNGRLYGLPHAVEQAAAVVIPVPWDSTVSYRAGTAQGPEAILKASLQVDLYDPVVPSAWRQGIAMLPLPADIHALNDRTRPKAVRLIDALEAGTHLPEADRLLAEVNAASAQVNQWVAQQATQVIAQGKIPLLLGGEHSTPLGLMQALSAAHKTFGILQIDAHMDLRDAYEGFVYSHASIMHHARQLPQVTRLVQVGIRDYGEGEQQVVAGSGGQIFCLTERERMAKQFAGVNWHEQVQELVAQLPQKVYISFDIDGLDPSLCPDTGDTCTRRPRLRRGFFTS